MRKWRKMSWVIFIWTVLAVLWIAADFTVKPNCAGLSASTCQGLNGLADGIAISFQVFVWFIGFIVFALIWFMSKPTRQPNSDWDPRCNMFDAAGNRCRGVAGHAGDHVV